MTTSHFLLRSTALSIITVSLVCNNAQAQLFRRSGDDQSANDRAKQTNTRDGKPSADPRQTGTQNANSANSRTQPNRGAPNSTNRNSGANAQANSNAQANRQSNTYGKSPSNPGTASQANKVGSGLANKVANPQTRPQVPGNTRPTNNHAPNNNAPMVPRSALTNQNRTLNNTPAVPQPPSGFSNQPVSQPAHSQSQMRPQSQPLAQQSVNANNNAGLFVAKEDSTQEAAQVDAQAIQAGANDVSEGEVLSRFGIQLTDEDDALLVSNLNANGNGLTAGLKRRDKIVSLGGAPLASKAEFIEIAKLLSVGDQIEIEFERNGKPEKSMIFYGQPNKEPANSEGSIQLEETNNWSTTPTDPTERLEKLVVEQQKIIAELQNRIRQLEAQSKTAF